MKDRIKMGFVGLSGRGFSLLKDIVMQMDDVDVTAVCDLYDDRIQRAAEHVKEVKGFMPFTTADYRELTSREDLDVVVIATAWEAHIEIALDAMRKGKFTAMEVGGAYSIDDCFELVKTSEETGMPCMLLENCCYGRTELMVMNMVKQGIFGEVVHCSGGYHHDLREEISFGKENRHYRLRNYLHRNCENYPTHELGPIAKILNINRGNRMLSLTSVASKSAGLHEYVLAKKGENDELADKKFAQGDVVTTCITCANGETIVLTLDTTLPRAYCRGFTVRGTKAAYFEDNRSFFINDEHHPKYEFDNKPLWGNEEQYYEKYDHPLWAEYVKQEVKTGHDGVDWLVFRALIESVKAGTQPPIDVYDAAAWMCISTLSEESIALGGAPVAIPDFTRGRWMEREPIVEGKYCLDKICVDDSVKIM